MNNLDSNNKISLSTRQRQAEISALLHNDFSNSEWVKYMPQGHVRLENVLFAPLLIEGKAVGLLGLSNKPGGFTENDAHLSSTFGELAAIGLLARTLPRGTSKGSEPDGLKR